MALSAVKDQWRIGGTDTLIHAQENGPGNNASLEIGCHTPDGTYLLCWMYVDVSATATTGSRGVKLSVKRSAVGGDDTDSVIELQVGANITLSQDKQVVCAAWGGNADIAGSFEGDILQWPLPSNIYVCTGDRLTVEDQAAIDAADTYDVHLRLLKVD